MAWIAAGTWSRSNDHNTCQKRRAGRWMMSCRSAYVASRYSPPGVGGVHSSRAFAEGACGAAIVIDDGQRVAHVAVAAAVERGRALPAHVLPGVVAVAPLLRQLFQEWRAFQREHGAGREIAEAQVAPAEHHEQQSHDVERRAASR